MITLHCCPSFFYFIMQVNQLEEPSQVRNQLCRRGFPLLRSQPKALGTKRWFCTMLLNISVAMLSLSCKKTTPKHRSGD